MNPKVDEFLGRAKRWQQEMTKLRAIVLDCGLNEELKWRQPCYSFISNSKESNVVIISSYKEFCILGFFKGALLNDANGLLVKPGENTQSGRQIRFTSVEEIGEKEAILKAYIYEAIEVERAGLNVEFKKTTEYAIPEELKKRLNQDPDLNSAFKALTPGRQRAYLLHFSGAKQSKTREARIEKYIPRILEGIGFNDCVCGLSKKKPYCDGSHKNIPKYRFNV